MTSPREAARRDIQSLGSVGPMLRMGQIAKAAVAAARAVPGVAAAALHLRDTVTGTVRVVAADPPDAAAPPPPDPEGDLDGVVAVAAGRPGAAAPAGGFAELAAILTVSLDRPLDEAVRRGIERAAAEHAEAVSTAIQFDYFFQRARSNYLVAEATKALVEDFPRLVADEDRIPRLLAKAAELVGPFLDIEGLVLVVGEPGSPPDHRLVVGRPASAAEHPHLARALAGEVVRDGPARAGDGAPLIALPMKVGDRTVGAAAIWRAAPLATHELLTLHTIVSQVGIATSNARLLGALERLAVTDGLTRLWNHKHFQERLRQETARAARYNQPLALLMIDIDDFKRVNDTHGHPVGDRLLEEVARLLRSCLREVDFLARYGGEEFAAILPSTDSEGAVVVADRILEAVRRYAFAAGGGPLPVRVSIGVASLPDDGLEAPRLVEAADRALYRAKADGKDRWRASTKIPT